MISIPTSLTGFVNEADVRGQALVALIQQYATLQVYWGFKNLGANDIVFPCIMVEPAREKFWMPALGKFRLEIDYNLYWYCQESNPEAIVTQETDIGAFLKKLFSNNALNDLGSANTKQFKQYRNPNTGGYYWLEATISDITHSPNYVNADAANQQVYMRAGLLQLHIMDQFVA